jgi:fructose-bisphosphate aldolase class I
MDTHSLDSTITSLLAHGKGILAADESFPTIARRFSTLQIPSTEESRSSYRELLFSVPGLGEFISGGILFDETLRQSTTSGVSFPNLLASHGIIPGIKVDKGVSDLVHFPGEKWTQGLDGLRERLDEYRHLGARFTKWRAVFSIGDQQPSMACMEVNARSLALFSALSQESGLVPIVEPEVLLDGDHTIDRCEEITNRVLRLVFAALEEHRVRLEQMILKIGMVLPGKGGSKQADPSEIAAATLRCFRHAVPAAVPGIVFLSGGQSDEAATQRLDAICRAGPTPWKLSFSFGRALQSPVLKAWKGRPENIDNAWQALHLRARLNSLALQGRYTSGLEKHATTSP